MKRFAMLAAILMLGAAACDDDDTPTNQNPNTQPIRFTAQLNTANEVPAIGNTSEAACTGAVVITFNHPRDPATGAITGAGTIDFAVTINNCPAGTTIRAAHIHNGAAGVQAGVFIDTGLAAANQIVLANGVGTFNLTSASIDQARAQAVIDNPAGHYFNAHSALNGGGVVRGQLTRLP